jgi:hypothetical protein
MEIIEIRTGCGCLLPRVEPRLLAPGERGRVTVDVNTLGQGSGPHSWKCVLRFRQGANQRERELELRAQLITEVTVQPAFLTLTTQGPRTQEFVLTDTRAQPLTVTAVQTHVNGLRAGILRQGRDEQGREQAAIVLDVSAALPDGRHEDTLDIYTDDPLYGHLQVPVRITKQSPSRLACAPQQLTFAGRPGQPGPARLLRVWSLDQHALDIAKVWADDPALACTWAVGPGMHQATVKVQIDARGRMLPEQTVVNIETRQPPGTLRVPVVFEAD